MIFPISPAPINFRSLHLHTPVKSATLQIFICCEIYIPFVYVMSHFSISATEMSFNESVQERVLFRHLLAIYYLGMSKTGIESNFLLFYLLGFFCSHSCSNFVHIIHQLVSETHQNCLLPAQCYFALLHILRSVNISIAYKYLFNIFSGVQIENKRIYHHYSLGYCLPKSSHFLILSVYMK